MEIPRRLLTSAYSLAHASDFDLQRVLLRLLRMRNTLIDIRICLQRVVTAVTNQVYHFKNSMQISLQVRTLAKKFQIKVVTLEGGKRIISLQN